MPNPKRKMSKTRRDKRRTHYKAAAPSLGKCSNCGELKLTHSACTSCGNYDGRSVLIPKS